MRIGDYECSLGLEGTTHFGKQFAWIGQVLNRDGHHRRIVALVGDRQTRELVDVVDYKLVQSVVASHLFGVEPHTTHSRVLYLIR